jgi:hypothetical protein
VESTIGTQHGDRNRQFGVLAAMKYEKKFGGVKGFGEILVCDECTGLKHL